MSSEKLSVGKPVWYMGLNQSDRCRVAVNEMGGTRIKLALEQPQFVRASCTRYDVRIYETISRYCAEEFIHIPD